MNDASERRCKYASFFSYKSASHLIKATFYSEARTVHHQQQPKEKHSKRNKSDSYVTSLCH